VRCHACGLEFADPMRSAGPDWYAACSIYAEAEAGAQLRWEHEQFGRARLQGRRLLEVGCGRGAFVELAASQGYLEDYFSLTSPLARRIAGRVCQGLGPLLRRWPTAGGCTLFAIGSKP
jgi:hypothetical protein